MSLTMFHVIDIMDPVNCPDRQSIGISNLHIGLNVNGENQYYTLANLHIEVGIRPDCHISAAEGVANAINQAILSAEIAISEGNLVDNLESQADKLKGTILREINRQLRRQFGDCNIIKANRRCDLAVAWPAEASLVNDQLRLENQRDYNTVYIPFESEFESRCN